MPVGAEISVCRPERMRGQPSTCGGEGEPTRSRNQRWTTGWKSERGMIETPAWHGESTTTGEHEARSCRDDRLSSGPSRPREMRSWSPDATSFTLAPYQALLAAYRPSAPEFKSGLAARPPVNERWQCPRSRPRPREDVLPLIVAQGITAGVPRFDHKDDVGPPALSRSVTVKRPLVSDLQIVELAEIDVLVVLEAANDDAGGHSNSLGERNNPFPRNRLLLQE